MNNETPKEFLETSDDDTWKPCIMCGGELTQERKAFFVCVNSIQKMIQEK